MTDAALAILREHLLQALDNHPGSETRRLFHGRGRCWPGLEQITVDWLQGVLLVSLFRAERPALVHGFTIKCAVYGSLAARLAGARRTG